MTPTHDVMDISDLACSADGDASRRFYVHEASFGFLVSCHPDLLSEVSTALAYSAAGRVTAHMLDEWSFMEAHRGDSELRRTAQLLNATAAGRLEDLFRCLVHLVPTVFGATQPLLGRHEGIHAWCYESGYFTYATGQAAAVIMYSETGSLRALRSQIRRSPESDSGLQMITGPSLFLADQAFGTGPGTANRYRRQASRLSRGAQTASCPPHMSFRLDGFGDELRAIIRPRTTDPRSEDLLQQCLRRAEATVSVLTGR